MGKDIKLTKGFDINLAGKPQPNVVTTVNAGVYAIKPSDFPGFVKPKVLVAEGDQVKAGTPLYFDKTMEQVVFTSPVSGKVLEVKRGDKRKLLEIIVEADGQNQYESFSKFSKSEISGKSADELKQTICKSGAWPFVVQRPYAVVANPDTTPKSIFISAFDTNPLSPDYSILFKGDEDAFAAGVEVLKKLTSGKVHVNVDGKGNVPSMFTSVSGVELNKFSGPHPAGNVGVQIHHIDPIGKDQVVWTVSPFGVIVIGRLFLEGRFNAARRIAVVGSEVKTPQYYSTFLGAKVDAFLKGNLVQSNVRVVSGSALSGERIDQSGFIGFYSNMITVLPEGNQPKFFGSFSLDSKRLSFGRAFGLLSFLNGGSKEYTLDTNINGEHRAFVQTGVMEQVLPMDIYPTYLLKAIITEDYDEMEALGILEVAEEDFALCEFVDVSKNDVQVLIRKGIDMMQQS